MTYAVALAIVVFLLGALVLVIKLKPQSASSSLGGSELSSAKQAVANDPDNPWTHVVLGVAYLKDENPDGAKAEFEEALKLDDTNWQANMQLAALIQDDDPQRAIDLYEKSIKTSVSPETPYLLLGQLQYKLGKYDDAKLSFLRSVAIEQAMYDSRLGLAQTYEALGEKRNALEQYKEALRLLPGDAAAKDAIDRLSSGGPLLTPSTSPAP